MPENKKSAVNTVPVKDAVNTADDIIPNTPQTTKKIPFSVVEAYKNIRTNVISLLEKDNYKIVSVSSPNASEGKSTTSINTAIALSQLNKKVLLIDADAHRPTIHKKLNLDNSDGLMNVIQGVSEFEKVVIHYNPSLDVIPSGPLPSNSTELFSAPEFEALLETVREQYDYIILDAPPINVLSDSLVIAQKCDGLILIIRAGVTTHESLKKTLKSAEVLDINIIGTILNGSDTGTKRYYKYYKSYGKYGKYGSYSKYYGYGRNSAYEGNPKQNT